MSNKMLSLSEQELKTAVEQSKQMAEASPLTPSPIPQHFLIQLLTQRIPLLAGILQSVDSTGTTVGKLLTVTGHIAPAIQTATKSFQYTGILLDILNFVRIPLLYLAAFFLREKVPFNLSNNAKWLYAGVLLTLGVVALTIPAVALPLAMTGAALVLSVGVFTLGRSLYQHIKNNKTLEIVEAELTKQEAALEKLRNEAQELQTSIKEAVINNPSAIPDLAMKVDDLQLQFDKQTKIVQNLIDKKHLCEIEKQKSGGISFLDKGVGILLSIVGVVGVGIAFAFPPVGLGILALTAATGTLYLIGRVTFALLPALFSKIAKKFGKQTEPLLEEETEKNVQPETGLNQAFHDSTVNTMQGLFGTNAEEVLREQLRTDIRLEKINANVSAIVRCGDLQQILNFFIRVSQFAKAGKFTKEDIKLFFNNLDEGDEALSLLRRAVEGIVDDKVTFSKAKKAQLFAYLPLQQALLDKGVDLQQINYKFAENSAAIDNDSLGMEKR